MSLKQLHSVTQAVTSKTYIASHQVSVQSWMKPLIQEVAASLVFSLLLTTQTHAVSFTYTKVVDNISGSFSSVGAANAINEQGLVVFSAILSTGGIGIFSNNDGSFSTIVDTSGSFNFIDPTILPFNSFDRITVNDSGTVAFTALLDEGGSGIFTSSGGSSTSIINIDDFYFYGTPAINNSGTVAFNVNLGGFNTDVEGIFSSTDGSLTTIADVNSFRFVGVPAINNSGTIAFSGSPSEDEFGIFTSSNGLLTPIADSRASISYFDDNVAINDSGVVATLAVLDNGSTELITVDNGLITTLADTRGSFSIFGPNLTINNNDTVVFKALLDEGGEGIFTQQAGEISKVIATGDPLFGSTVSIPYISNKALNDSGQIVFSASLADGSQGIFLANPISEPPTSVPEPASVFGLLLLSVFAVGSSRLT